MTHNSQLAAETPQRGLIRTLRPVALPFSNFLGRSHTMRWGLASARAAALSLSLSLQVRRRHNNPQRPPREKTRDLGCTGRGRAGPSWWVPAPRPGFTFQIAAGGRREPLLGFAAHQLQADLQHGPAATAKAPPPRAPSPARPRSPRSQPGPHPGPRPASRLPPRPVTKGPAPRPVRPLTPSRPRNGSTPSPAASPGAAPAACPGRSSYQDWSRLYSGSDCD